MTFSLHTAMQIKDALHQISANHKIKLMKQSSYSQSVSKFATYIIIILLCSTSKPLCIQGKILIISVVHFLFLRPEEGLPYEGLW